MTGRLPEKKEEKKQTEFLIPTYRLATRRQADCPPLKTTLTQGKGFGIQGQIEG
jgi:hypothetical protein